jgi:hypothetical protein
MTANSHAPMSLFRVINHGKERVGNCLLGSKTAASLAGYSTSAKAVVEKIFGDSKSAEFVAGAGSTTSIPKLHGLPEVCQLSFLKSSGADRREGHRYRLEIHNPSRAKTNRRSCQVVQTPVNPPYSIPF